MDKFTMDLTDVALLSVGDGIINHLWPVVAKSLNFTIFKGEFGAVKFVAADEYFLSLFQMKESAKQ